MEALLPCICLSVFSVAMLAKISQGPTQLSELFSAMEELISMQDCHNFHKFLVNILKLSPFAAVTIPLQNFTLQRMGVLCISLYTTYAQFLCERRELCEIVTSSDSWRTKIQAFFFF